MEFRWLKDLFRGKSEKELLNGLHGQFVILNKILGEMHEGLQAEAKTELSNFARSSLTVCENFRKSYPTINLMRYKLWVERILGISGRFIDRCAQIDDRRTRVKYEEVLVKINEMADDLLKIIDSYAQGKKAA